STSSTSKGSRSPTRPRPATPRRRTGPWSCPTRRRRETNMRGIASALLAALLLLAAGTARAEGLRDFCPDRPGLGTPACTMDPGHIAVELGLGDWTLTRQSGE